MHGSRIAAACDVAAASSRRTFPPPEGRPRRIRVAIGDPQAPLERFFAILDHNGLLSDAGRLRDDVLLVSMGDHFDWGEPADRPTAASSGAELLAWLASHPADQVVVLAGNHDLARVGELAGVTGAEFEAMRDAADAVYPEREVRDHAREAAFRAVAPNLPSAELVARDFASFTVAQRELVARLLTTGRFRAACALDRSVLLTHAGLSIEDLDMAQVPVRSQDDGVAIAEALNAGFDAVAAAWTARDPGTPFTWKGLHVPGNGSGEGRGIFYQRPSNPRHEKSDARFEGPPHRRFDARRLPLGLTQVVGHTADRKCRDMLGPWADPAPATPGVLRHLRTRGGSDARYAHGTPSEDAREPATMIFIDGHMAKGAVERYELLDLTTMHAFRRSE